MRKRAGELRDLEGEYEDIPQQSGAVANSRRWFTTSFLRGRCRKAMLGVWCGGRVPSKYRNERVKRVAIVRTVQRKDHAFCYSSCCCGA